MKRALPPYVYAKKAKGKTYYRFQKGIVSQPIDPSADTFWQTYAEYLACHAWQVVAMWVQEKRRTT